ncbi:MAG: hypothetical protein HY858_16170 [Candidatus Solibacter usitatus]|nr:hypothetical protein [Candidatus Solibacter usitatus]
MSLENRAACARPTWHHPKILLVLLAVFLCGAAAGALTVRLAPVRSAAAGGWEQGGREMTIAMMKKELDLTPAQAAEIETVLDEFVLYYANLQGQMDDFRSEGKTRIVRVLTPEQRARFEKMMTGLSARLR